MKRPMFFALFACLVFASASIAQKPFTTSGYYDGIKMSSKESGDYVGMNVFLTESDGQLFAVVTTAEGGFSSPKLVEAKQTGKDMRGVEFTLPDDNGPRTFKGTVTALGFNVTGSNGVKYAMKRTCGSLFSDITMGKGGDYGGTELFLAEGGGDSYVLVTIAEGVMKRPVLVPAKMALKGGEILGFDYALPGDNGERKFTAKYTKTGLSLTEAGTTTALKSKCYK